jgi:hypothetical protein
MTSVLTVAAILGALAYLVCGLLGYVEYWGAPALLLIGVALRGLRAFRSEAAVTAPTVDGPTREGVVIAAAFVAMAMLLAWLYAAVIGRTSRGFF